MENVIPPPALPQDCLDKLSRVLDLVLKTAETASAENNHKLVIQSAREATRIVALMHNMTQPAPSRRSGRTAEPGAPVQQTSPRPEPTGTRKPAAGRTGRSPDDFNLSDLEMLRALQDPAYWDEEPGNFFKKIGGNRELQALEKEVAAFLKDTNRKSGAAR